MQITKNIDFKKDYSAKIQPLFKLGRKLLLNSEKQLKYEKFGFTNEDIPELLKLALNNIYNEIEEEELELYKKEVEEIFYASIYALYILGKLQAVDVIEPILEKLYYDKDNEFFFTSIPGFFADIGEKGIEPLTEHIQNRDEVNLILFEVFIDIVKKNPKTEEGISSFLMDYITNKQYKNPVYMGFAIASLVDIDGIKYIDAIREAFATKEVDFTIVGDLAYVEKSLGLRK
jgi:hypothetical protein